VQDLDRGGQAGILQGEFDDEPVLGSGHGGGAGHRAAEVRIGQAAVGQGVAVAAAMVEEGGDGEAVQSFGTAARAVPLADVGDAAGAEGQVGRGGGAGNVTLAAWSGLTAQTRPWMGAEAGQDGAALMAVRSW
jgi:hypothetical protein